MTVEERTFEVAQEVATLLAAHGADVAVIGGVAVAAHGYARATEDFDLATATDPYTVLRRVAEVLKSRGYDAAVELPDEEDAPGGVLSVDAPGADRVQVVNYFRPTRGNIDVAVARAKSDLLPPFRVVDLPHLIALKLYAGGRKSELDVLELLERNPEEAEESRVVCERLGLAAAFARVRAG